MLWRKGGGEGGSTSNLRPPSCLRDRFAPFEPSISRSACVVLRLSSIKPSALVPPAPAPSRARRRSLLSSVCGDGDGDSEPRHRGTRDASGAQHPRAFDVHRRVSACAFSFSFSARLAHYWARDRVRSLVRRLELEGARSDDLTIWRLDSAPQRLCVALLFLFLLVFLSVSSCGQLLQALPSRARSLNSER